MSDTCGRCGKAIFAAENPTRMTGFICHNACFKCKVCNIKLTYKSAFSEEGDVYCEVHKPSAAPNQTVDVTMQTAMSAPNSAHGTVQFVKTSTDHTYGQGAVGVETAKAAPKVPATVQNVNRMEQRHQGVSKFAST